jgi:hypothetical protein
MDELIVIVESTGREIHRRAMDPGERYTWYTACFDHEIVTFNGVSYHAIKGAWQVPEHNFVMTVMAAMTPPCEERYG